MTTEQDGLVADLRQMAKRQFIGWVGPWFTKAADRIEALTAERDEAKCEKVAVEDRELELAKRYERLLGNAADKVAAYERRAQAAESEALSWKTNAAEEFQRRQAAEQKLQAAVDLANYANDIRWLEPAQGAEFTTIDRMMLRDLRAKAAALLTTLEPS